MQFALAQHSTSKPIPVAAGTIVSVTPSAGATVLVEYSSDSFANIANGTATWSAWTPGLVTAAAQDTLASATTVRITTNGGSTYVDLNDAPSSTSGNGGGVNVVATAKYTPAISQYDRALIFPPPPRQLNAVKGLSRNINDLQYVGLITDADVYDTEPGALRVGQSTSKALAFHWGKMSWDLGAGESLLLQMRVKTVGASGTSSTHLFGNYNGTDSGIDVILYDPANATFPGYLIINYKAQGAAAQSLQVPAAVIGASTVTPYTIPTDTYVNITIHVDGATRLMYVYTNGQPHINAGTTVLNPGSSLQTAGSRRNFGIGHIPVDDSFSTSLAKAVGLQAFRMAVLPAGLRFISPAGLDRRFNRNPFVEFSDTDYTGAP